MSTPTQTEVDLAVICWRASGVYEQLGRKEAAALLEQAGYVVARSTRMQEAVDAAITTLQAIQAEMDKTTVRPGTIRAHTLATEWLEMYTRIEGKEGA